MEIGSDSVVTLSGLRDVRTGDYINSATVTGSLHDADGTLIYGAISFEYRDDSDGVYDGVIPASITEDLSECVTYLLEVTATKDGSNRFWREKVQAFYGGMV